MPGRKYEAQSGYRYGFNGKEKDTEGIVQYDYGFRIYDPRLVRFKSVDPLSKSYPYYTPFQFAGNMPICAIDLDGLEEYVVVKELYKNGQTKRISIQYTLSKDKLQQTINMQFKQVLGKNSDGSEILGDPLTSMRVVRIIRNANGSEITEYDDELKKEELRIVNQNSDNEESDPKMDSWELIVDKKNFTSGIKRDETTQQDKIAVKEFHLIKNLSRKFSGASYYSLTPSGQGALIDKKYLIGLNSSGKSFFELPSLIKEDGGIKSIEITLTQYVTKDLDDVDFNGLKKAFDQVVQQVKELYSKSGVKNVNVNYDLKRSDDPGEMNRSTPDIEIKMKR